MATKIMPILAFIMLMTLYMADAIVITDWRITWLRNPIMRVAFTKYQSDQPVSHYFPYGPPKYYCHSNYAFYQLYICNAAQQGAHRTDGCLWNILNDFNGFHFFNAYSDHFATEIIDLTRPEITAIKSGNFQICLLDATSMFMKRRNKRSHGYGIRCASPYECMRLPRFCWNVYHPALANAETAYKKRNENLKKIESKNMANFKAIEEQNKKMQAMQKQIQDMESSLAILLEMNQKNTQEIKSKNLEIMDLGIEAERIKKENVYKALEIAEILEKEKKKLKGKRQESLKNEDDAKEKKKKVNSEKEMVEKEKALNEEKFARLMAEINSDIDDVNAEQEQNISINLVGNHNNLSLNNVKEQIAAVKNKMTQNRRKKRGETIEVMENSDEKIRTGISEVDKLLNTPTTKQNVLIKMDAIDSIPIGGSLSIDLFIKEVEKVTKIKAENFIQLNDDKIDALFEKIDKKTFQNMAINRMKEIIAEETKEFHGIFGDAMKKVFPLFSELEEQYKSIEKQSNDFSHAEEKMIQNEPNKSINEALTICVRETFEFQKKLENKIEGQERAKKDDAEISFDKAEEKETNANYNDASSWEKGKKLAANSLEKVWEHGARILTSEAVTRVKDMGIEKAKKVNDVGLKFIANMGSKAKEHGFRMTKTVSKKSQEILGEIGTTGKDLALKGKEKIGRMIEAKYNTVKELIKAPSPSRDQQLVKEQIAQMQESGRSPGVKHVLLGHAKYRNHEDGAAV